MESRNDGITEFLVRYRRTYVLNNTLKFPEIQHIYYKNYVNIRFGRTSIYMYKKSVVTQFMPV